MHEQLSDQSRSLWAIVPARAGSQEFPDKNVATLLGASLIEHAVRFAHMLSFVDRILVSTDSHDYAEVARRAGVDVPFLRGAAASGPRAMEEDVLEDIRRCLERAGETPPNDVLWLRPTHPLRCAATFERAYMRYRTGKCSSVCIVTPADPRLFRLERDRLTPLFTGVSDRSMHRRQDVVAAYRMYHGEFFPFPSEYDPTFLGSCIAGEVGPNGMAFDIDSEHDLRVLEGLLGHDGVREELGPLIHAGSRGQAPAGEKRPEDV